MSVRALFLRAVVVALALLSVAGALPAFADDGRPQPGETGHPPSPIPVPRTQLAPTAIQTAAVPAASFGADAGLTVVAPVQIRKELVVFVGGYGSTKEERDAACADLATSFSRDRYDMLCFGDDPAFPYDTYGPIDASAQTLIAQIRSKPSQYAGINVIAHSMGGAVADRAIADGLASSDGVRTYIAIASPHSGADFARVPLLALPKVTPAGDAIRGFAVGLARDPDSAAARDLATFRPVAPPVGIAKLDISLATDGLVARNDARDPGVAQRVFLPASLHEALDGHGGSLTNREVRGVVVEMVRTHSVPPDRRSALTLLLAPLLWPAMGGVWLLGLLALVGACWIAATVLASPPCRPLLGAANRFARALLRSRGR